MQFENCFPHRDQRSRPKDLQQLDMQMTPSLHPALLKNEIQKYLGAFTSQSSFNYFLIPFFSEPG